MTVVAARPEAPGPGRLTLAERAQRAAFTAISRLPESLLHRLAPHEVNSDGDVMAPEIAVLMKATAGAGDFSDGTVAQARAGMEDDCRIFADDSPPIATEQFVLPSGIAATRYRSTEPSRGGPSSGLVVFIHGGGFAIGSRQAYDAPIRLIAARAGVDVLSVEYRLAPESPFPAAVEDAHEAWQFALDHAAEWGVDPQRIVLLGDSAGANLCAVLSNALRDDEVRPRMQVLMYPVVDSVGTYPSRTEFAHNPALTAKQIDWFSDLYAPDRSLATDPRVSPLLADDLSGAPATLITVAGFDPLRDEGIAYAARLVDAGVPTRLLREGGLVHGYISYTRISPTARAAVDRVADAVADALR